MKDVWEGHDCTICKSHGTCPLEPALEFLKTHDEEVAAACKSLRGVTTIIIGDAGSLLLDDNSPVTLAICLTVMADMLVSIGYSRGRSHVEIPPAFMKE